MKASTPAARTPWSLRASCRKSDDSTVTTPDADCTRASESGATERLFVEVVAQLLRARGMTQLRQRLRLDLPDPLSGDAELLADFFQRSGMSIGEAEAQLDDALLPVRKGVQDRVELLLQQDERSGVDGHDRVAVLDEVAEVGVLLLTDRRLKRDRLLGELLNLPHALGRHLHLQADLLRRRLAAEVLQQLALDTDQLVDGLD